MQQVLTFLVLVSGWAAGACAPEPACIVHDAGAEVDSDATERSDGDPDDADAASVESDESADGDGHETTADRADSDDDASADEADEADGADTRPTFTFAPVTPPPCGDWEPIGVTSPTEVPPGTTEVTQKWQFVLGVGAGLDSYRIAEKQDGAVCAIMNRNNQFGCVGRDGALQWVSAYDFHGDPLTGGVAVTPQGEVVAQSVSGEVMGVRPAGPGPDNPTGEVWRWGPDSPPRPDTPVATGRPPIYVASGGYLFHAAPWSPTRLDLFDRCGGYHWRLDGVEFVLDGGEGGVLGDKLIAAGLLRGDPWPPPAGTLRVFAVEVAGSLRELALPTTEVVTGARALGRGRLGLLEVIGGWSDSDPRSAVRWWRMDEDGAAIRMSSMRDPPWVDAIRSAAVWPDESLGAVVAYPPPTVSVKYDGDGRLTWTAADRGTEYSQWELAGVGRDGRLIVLRTRSYVPGGANGTEVVVHGVDGAVEHDVLVPDVIRDGAYGGNAILAADGTLYFVGRGTDGETLVAVQTPVAGFTADDSGWARAWGRDSRGDMWAR